MFVKRFWSFARGTQSIEQARCLAPQWRAGAQEIVLKLGHKRSEQNGAALGRARGTSLEL